MREEEEEEEEGGRERRERLFSFLLVFVSVFSVFPFLLLLCRRRARLRSQRVM